jgi:phospholipid-binding lipoprotein MlaA
MRRTFLLAAVMAPIVLAQSPALAQVGTTGDIQAATADLEEAATPSDVGTADPWEGFNRKMFAANQVFDDILLVPLAKTYRFVTPGFARQGLRNFLDNGMSVNILFNDLLQGEFERGGETLARFIINSAIGVGGLFDPATRLGIPKHNEDFGQTLAVWGIGSGPYLYMPIFGPSSVRDGFGLGVDIAADPLFWIDTRPAHLARYSRFGATAVAKREPFIEPLEEIQEKSLDYYASLRSFYLQARKREIANGETNYEDLPDIGEYEEFEDLQ